MPYLIHNVVSDRFSFDSFCGFWRDRLSENPQKFQLDFGGKTIGILLYEPSFEAYLQSYFAPVLRKGIETECDLTLHIGRWQEGQELPVNCENCGRLDLWKHDDGNAFFLLHPQAGCFLSCDLAAREGFIFVNNGCTLRLEALLFRFALANDLLLLHAGAVGLNGRGVLLCGQSGQGKSTTALSCLMAGMDFLADDMVLLDKTRRARPLYSTCKVSEKTLQRYPSLAEGIFAPPGMVPLDPLKQDINLYQLFQNSFSEMTIDALLLPVIDPGRREPRIEKCLSAAALMPLVYSSFTQFHDQGNAAGTRKYIAALHRLPAYKIYLSTNYGKNAESLKLFIKEEIAHV